MIDLSATVSAGPLRPSWKWLRPISEVAGTMTELSSSIGDNSIAIMHMSSSGQTDSRECRGFVHHSDETAATDRGNQCISKRGEISCQRVGRAR